MADALDPLYFLGCLGAIAWLALWSIRSDRAARRWWPFDMKASAPPEAPTVVAADAVVPEEPSWRRRAREANGSGTRSARRRGGVREHQFRGNRP